MRLEAHREERRSAAFHSFSNLLHKLETISTEQKVSMGRGIMGALSVTACLLVSAFVSLAQGERGAVAGTVTDQDGAVVSGAPIQAKNAKTGVTYKATSSLTGKYALEQLPPGTYELSIPLPEFMYRRQTVVVRAAQKLNLNIRVEDNSLKTLGEDRAYFAGLVTSRSSPTSAAPRTQSGKPDFSGMWQIPRIVDPEAPPVLPWAADVIKQWVETNGRDFPRGHCLPDSVQLMGRFGVNRWIQTASVVVILNEADIPGYHQIFLDGRPHPGDLDPTWSGHSVGKWEGDTLVVDTVGFNNRTPINWLVVGGSTPHTEKLHLITRFRRPDLGHLEIEVTFDDPGAFTKPWKMKEVSELDENEDVQEWICNENNQDVEHMVGK
jgi:hypothetical protein